MRKWLGGCTAVILIALIGTLFFGWKQLPRWLSSHLSEKMGVAVSIQTMTLAPSSLGVYELVINSPKGCILPRAFTAKEIKVDAPLTRYLRQDVVIDKVVLQDVYMGLELTSTTNSQGNWSVIMDNLNRSLQENPSNGKVLIKELTVRNLQIDLVFRQGNRQVKRLKPIPVMSFQNVSSETGLPLD